MLAYLILFIIIAVYSIVIAKAINEKIIIAIFFFLLPIDLNFLAVIFPDSKIAAIGLVPDDFLFTILVALYVLKKKEYNDNIKVNNLLIFIIILIVIFAFIPTIRAQHLNHSLVNYYQNIIYPIFIFFFIIKYINENEFEKIFKIMVISLAIFCMYAFFEHYIILHDPFKLISFSRGEKNYASLFGQRNSLAIEISRLLPFAIYFGLKIKSYKYRVLNLLILFTLIITFSRSGWLALGTIFVLLFYFFKKEKKIVGVSFTFILILVIFFSTNTIFFYRITEPFLYRNITFTDRTFIWSYAFELLGKNLLSGFSRSDFTMNAGNILNFGINIGSTHNVILDLLLFLSFPAGILFFLLVLYFLLLNYKIIKKGKKELSIYTFILISQLVFILQGLGESTYFSPFRSTMFWLFAALVYKKYKIIKKENFQKNSINVT